MFTLVVGIFCTLSLLGTLIYYFGEVTPVSYGIAFIVTILGAAFVWRRRPKADSQLMSEPTTKPAWTWWLLTIGLTIALGAWWSVIWSVQITEAVRSPWLAVAPIGVLALGLAIFFLYALCLAPVNSFWPIGQILLTLFSAVSLASVVYPLGFGFDPFLHRATIAHIAEFGTITPKPLYYIGLYALELYDHQIFQIPIGFIDRWLVPLIGSGLFIGSAWLGLTQTLQTKRTPALLAVFLFPLSALTVTTPQSLAFVTTASLLFLSLPRLTKRENSPHWGILALLTATTLAIHPLAGIPAAIYLGLVGCLSIKSAQLRRLLIIFGSCLGAVALPLVFVLQAKTSGLPINFSLAHLFDWSKLGLSGFFGNRFNTWYDGLYLVIDNLLLILALFAIFGFVSYRRQEKSWSIHLPLLAAVICFINYILMSLTLEFDFLIEYERADYAVRLLTLTMIFLLPHVAFLIHRIDRRLSEESAGLRIAFAGLIALVVTANIYGAYPRHDNYARSAGFNVAQNDFDAVRAIAELGGDTEYIVLANQAVSAAAVETYGFKKYYHGDIFYYPIPTGGLLYEYFLAMNETPSREVINQALEATGTNLAFYVVNDYWWQAEKIIENTKNQADDWLAVGNVTIFKFTR
jgi:hypothetical protein